jgi:hypothetical protein
MAGEIGVFTEPNARRVWQATLDVERWLGRNSNQTQEQRHEYIQFKNASGETIPPYACMQVDGKAEEAGRHLLRVKKPFLWTNALVGPFLFNTGWEVANGDYGTAQFGPVFRAIKDSSVTLGINVRIGPINNSWKVGKGCMYSMIETDTIETDCIRFISNETPILAITDAAIPGNGDGQVTKKDPSSGDWVAGSVTYTVRNPSPTDIPNAALVICFPVDAKWAAVAIC